MKILLVAATELELRSLKEKWSSHKRGEFYLVGENKVEFFVSGVGMLPTAVHLTKHLEQNSYDLALNIGIVGSLKSVCALGEVIEVISDQVYQEGAENKDEYHSIYELDLRDANEFPFKNGVLNSTFCHSSFPQKKVRGISVNLVHGNQKNINRLEKSNVAEVESMEGAAFFYACLHNNIKAAQIKAVSNFIEPRNRENWKIPLALENLTERSNQIITTLK